MRSLTTKVNIVYWLLVVADIWSILASDEQLHDALKPLLMPALACSLLIQRSELKGFWIVIAALAFSWFGDVFLIFENYEPVFFMLGLGSFLVAHLFYIRFFLSIQPAIPGLLKKRPIFIIIVTVYCIGLFLLLLPSLEPLKIPVFIYALVIGCMLLASIHVSNKLGRPANIYYIAGATLFLLSDSLLAINKFYQPVPAAGAAIMLTYCAAQFFIVKGFLEKRETLSPA
ncbi:MAG: lysoplasmalogenase [Ferruginibacter sp.]|nr:lysoplasmalogenase [Ferruginibacter sp.]